MKKVFYAHVNENNKCYIMSLWAFLGLARRGFLPDYVRENKKTPGRYIWIFDYSSEFETALREVFAEKYPEGEFYLDVWKK